MLGNNGIAHLDNSDCRTHRNILHVMSIFLATWYTGLPAAKEDIASKSYAISASFWTLIEAYESSLEVPLIIGSWNICCMQLCAPACLSVFSLDPFCHVDIFRML